ncbi:hypothetical protein NQ315_001977 [Exocentrus adspersus]|uniref:Uncharacterized protein n=1 Tax=Exocentrus adspersus TaxID=1586481 RepID=A0AAV8WA78_9CUCU|nr:hypothetical protein NQ315_001977 [Exocentrus adspersus]
MTMIIAAHPNIKLFVTQGGLQSMEEGIYAEVPFVVIPFFADQDQNAHLMQQKGIAVVVDRFPHIEKEELKTAMLEVLNNRSYRNAVKRLKHLAIDTPMTGLETAVWWIEYVIRHKGAKHLRNPAADLPFYQYYLIDVIGFLVTVAAVVLTVLFILVRKFISIFKVFIIDNSVATTKKLQ